MSRLWTVLSVITIVVVAACAPKPVSAPPASTAAPTNVAPQVTGSTAANKVEDEAWAKVVQEAKKEGTVAMFAYNLVGDAALAVAKAFKERYGITVEFLGVGGFDTVERIKTEYRSDQHTIDMVDNSILLTRIIVDGGFSARIIDLPVFSEKGVWYAPVDAWDNQGRNLVTYRAVSGPFVNTNLVKPEEYPTSWYDLLGPKWKGQITIISPLTTSSLDFYYHVFEGRGILEKGYFEKLGKQNLIFATGSQRANGDILARGEAKLALLSQASALPFVNEGAPVKAVTLKEGVLGSSYGVTMLSKVPHPNATKVYINWLFSKEGATVLARAAKTVPIRKDVPDFTPDAVKMSLEKVHTTTAAEADLGLQTYKDGLVAKMLGAKK